MVFDSQAPSTVVAGGIVLTSPGFVFAGQPTAPDDLRETIYIGGSTVNSQAVGGSIDDSNT